MRASELRLAQSNITPKTHNITGGLDLVTPPHKTKPGTLRRAVNYEMGIDGEATSVMGYERYDGLPKPSDAQYSMLPSTFSGTVSVGDTVTGVDSSATGYAIAVTLTDVVLTKVNGIFNSGEVLNVSGSPEATTTGIASISGASTALLHAQYNNLAADQYRADIAAVPGSGDVLGICMIHDVKYAFRNNAGGTATDLYKSTAAGWVQVDLGLSLPFTSGSVEILDGHVIDALVGGAQATVGRVAVESGSWDAGTAAGKLYFASQTGTFQAGGIEVSGGGDIATIAGDSSAITLLPDGDYKFVRKNFGGQLGTKRLYGCDGVNNGFEFDGTTYAPIYTGMTNDAPTELFVHKLHLFFAFGSSAQHSGIGTPFTWTVLTGAAELALGDTITGFKQEAGSEGGAALGIYSRNSNSILYGASSADWWLVPSANEIGVISKTIQSMHTTIALDDRGVIDMNIARSLGDSEDGTLSWMVNPWIQTQKTKAVTSCVSRVKSQYRLFFSDKYALFATFNKGQVVGMMPIQLDHTVTCMFSQENDAGEEEIFFGSDDGFVYQMEKGTSFDGNNIDGLLEFHYNHGGTLGYYKRYKSCSIEASAPGYAAYSFSFELGYNSALIAQSTFQASQASGFSPAYWDEFTWDEFYWDGQGISNNVFKVGGSAENFSPVLTTSSDYCLPISFSAYTLRSVLGKPIR